MKAQSFGGKWTDEKLECVRRYLVEYTKIFHADEQRKAYFNTHYIDAFAGSGFRAPEQRRGEQAPQLSFDDPDPDGDNFLKGSTRIALEVEPQFDRYIFVELNRTHAGVLEALKGEYSTRDIEVIRQDANAYLNDWCRTMDRRHDRAVVFLDPFGMEVEWATIQCLADTEAIDLWYLFPLSGVNRLLTRDWPPPQTWKDRLTLTFGTSEWERAFYRARETATFFGTKVENVKETDFLGITEFTVERLRTAFPAVAPRPRVLLNPKQNNPLFLLCFASASKVESTQKAALNIASYILSM